MILEHALLQVSTGRQAEFEADFGRAKAIIAGAAGFGGLRLERCLEVEGRYVLLVEWASLEDHTVGFRQSPAYDEWRALLHHYYDPFPVVEHFETVHTA